ncbi:Epidermal retinol dehydrogenase 2 [Trachymyrmex cornetzi]|uniref:Short-chain dehydrogenase/reductase 3 n=1 Tax=Trachymyrmex cornetzi TaxID=471704 RepID=A0A151JNM7_9HYME|nr:Epidermal retinol dehydrogenase 2 [Trachymyrmex cornetzi]
MMTLKKGVHIIYDLLLFIGLAIVYFTEAVVLMLIPRRYRAKSIKGEIALITGGASGIGKLIAIKFAKLGAHVIVWDINKNGLAEVAEQIKKAGGKCWTYCCDIGDKEAVYHTVKAVQIEIGNVSLLVNNAGYVYGKTFMELPDWEIEQTFKVNILSHYWITKSFLKDMIKNNHGHIVTIASVAGLLGIYKCTDYSATKFAAIGCHESLFTELKMHGYEGIHMTLVCPYLINTGMFNGVKPRLIPMLEPEYVAEEVIAGVLANRNSQEEPLRIFELNTMEAWLGQEEENWPNQERSIPEIPELRTSSDRNSSRPFVNVGVDFCGPFFTKEKKFNNRVCVRSWRLWHKEYLNELNQRLKWKSSGSRKIAIDHLVLIKEDNSPPLSWPIGRVLKIHPGKDNIICVVTIKTIAGVYKRNVRSLAILPIDTTDSR